MTNEEINKIIAEYCGWKYEFNGNDEDPEWYWIPPNNPDGNGTPPDYCNDLNEMHELENTLYKGFIDKDYWQKGYGRFQNLLGELSTNPYSANARQRAEAFLRTIGKWKE